MLCTHMASMRVGEVAALRLCDVLAVFSVKAAALLQLAEFITVIISSNIMIFG